MQADLAAQMERFRHDFQRLVQELSKVFVGERETIEGILTALVAGGHVLVEGLPGTGKTALGRALAEVLDVSFQRIQCTPDLMTADVIGTYVIMETPQGRRTFEFQKGPLFANVVLADQINRTTPKTQAAMLEAMDERAVTVATERFELPRPHFILATQNPSEAEGTFPLPEAQVDRFLLKLVLPLPAEAQLEQILDRTTEAEPVAIRPVLDAARIAEMGEVVRRVPIAGEVRRQGIRLVAATHPNHPAAPELVRRFVRYGAGPRGAQALILAAKTRAVVQGRDQVAPQDLLAVAAATLAHRLVLNYEGQAEGIAAEALVADIIGAFGEGLH